MAAEAEAVFVDSTQFEDYEEAEAAVLEELLQEAEEAALEEALTDLSSDPAEEESSYEESDHDSSTEEEPSLHEDSVLPESLDTELEVEDTDQVEEGDWVNPEAIEIVDKTTDRIVELTKEEFRRRLPK